MEQMPSNWNVHFNISKTDYNVLWQEKFSILELKRLKFNAIYIFFFPDWGMNKIQIFWMIKKQKYWWNSGVGKKIEAN